MIVRTPAGGTLISKTYEKRRKKTVPPHYQRVDFLSKCAPGRGRISTTWLLKSKVAPAIKLGALYQTGPDVARAASDGPMIVGADDADLAVSAAKTEDELFALFDSSALQPCTL